MITVIDYDTKQPVANAMVSLYDEFNAFIANLGFTDNSGVIMFADFTLSPGGVGEEVRIVPVGNKFTLEALCATREK